ncbi:phage putative head morphogenesis protein, SPP1 gp7 family [Hoeflea phototrophica DFL-43]|jgi:SPP1 gp7 family putative phage head morphogenesis protein|uniref:Phage putative head morphogenesis protein, SPP1 gp7 family n=1 Tax=Hoeflea phototrophica (strain DSM 17068 / NCIMB 14078 / DFL-43) TaxID=411684 RepID=A9D2W7_HOEPD|nr:phage minor head protein [Hoeflea phototrophica]EDQ34288.1 phage putative head morphogenesis protein, SPP1 gp7 family [Hoeflea phototrophica DFL-43]
MVDSVKFNEAINFLRQRLALPDGVWLKLFQEADKAARDRSAGMSEAMVRDILEAVLTALEEGTTVETFRDDFDAIATARGWAGDNTVGWRSALTFRVMTAQAMAAGRWRQIQRLKARRPWLRYITAGDHRVRDAHKAWHGIILSADDPWWQTHFPPNGFNCRCHVQQLSDRDLKRYGLNVTPEAPSRKTVIRFARGVDGVRKPVEVPEGIDPGFAVNLGEMDINSA